VSLFTFVFGRIPHRPLQTLDHAPPGVRWRSVRPKPSIAVRAEIARESGEIEKEAGVLRYEAGKHYIIHYGPQDSAPVRREVFEQTYERRDDGLYEKRTDIVLRYFTLSYPVIVETLEGDELAHPGDWIMQGVIGELYPIAARDAEAKYAPM
jgi:hypothetical protein